MSNTVVLQSHRLPLPHDWLEPCLQSVRAWAQLNDYEYVFLGDELFDSIDDEIVQKTRTQVVVASDLARLLQIRSLLKQGYESVIWCDADFLIFDANGFTPRDTRYALGREVWVQRDEKSRLRAYSKVHNAFLMFRRGNCFLDFYAETAEKLLLQNNGPMPAQFIGPKLLTALHNIAQCPVQENAGMLSPLVVQDIIKGGGEALDLFIQKSPQPISAANLCCSSVDSGALISLDMDVVVKLLLNSANRIFS